MSLIFLLGELPLSDFVGHNRAWLRRPKNACKNAVHGSLPLPLEKVCGLYRREATLLMHEQVVGGAAWDI
jgi:hypothetical protein